MRRRRVGIALLFSMAVCLCLAGCSAFIPTVVSETIDSSRITGGEHAWPSPVANAAEREMVAQPAASAPAQDLGEAAGAELPAEAAETERPTEAFAPAAGTEGPADRTGPPASAEAQDLPLSGITIGIDPGHQASPNTDTEPQSPGSSVRKPKSGEGVRGVTTGTADSAINLSVGMKLRDLLAEQGAEVVMTRESQDVDISNIERASIMNAADVDLAVRIFCNADSDSSVQGVLVLVPSGPDTAAIQDASSAAGRCVLNAFVDATGADSLGLRYTDSQTMFNWSEVPVINVGLGELTNAAEDQRLASDSYQNQAAQGILLGIMDYFAA